MKDTREQGFRITIRAIQALMIEEEAARILAAEGREPKSWLDGVFLNARAEVKAANMLKSQLNELENKVWARAARDLV